MLKEFQLAICPLCKQDMEFVTDSSVRCINPFCLLYNRATEFDIDFESWKEQMQDVLKVNKNKEMMREWLRDVVIAAVFDHKPTIQYQGAAYSFLVRATR